MYSQTKHGIRTPKGELRHEQATSRTPAQQGGRAVSCVWLHSFGEQRQGVLSHALHLQSSRNHRRRDRATSSRTEASRTLRRECGVLGQRLYDPPVQQGYVQQALLTTRSRHHRRAGRTTTRITPYGQEARTRELGSKHARRVCCLRSTGGASTCTSGWLYSRASPGDGEGTGAIPRRVG